MRLPYRSKDRFARSRVPEWLRTTIGGLLVVPALRIFPEVYGASFDAMESALWVRLPWELLLGLFSIYALRLHRRGIPFLYATDGE